VLLKKNKRCCEKNTINCVEIKLYEKTHWLFIDLNKAYDSIRKDFLHNIPIDFGMPMKNVLK